MARNHVLAALCLSSLAVAGCNPLADFRPFGLAPPERMLQARLRPVGGAGPGGRLWFELRSELFQRGSRRFCAVLALADPDAATAAHIHRASTGEVVYTAEFSATINGPAGRSRTGCTPADHALIGLLRQNAGAYYADVHTAERPSGAFRGRLRRG